MDRIAHLLTKLRKRFPADVELTEVEAFLSSEGYNRREIGEIVSAWASDIAPADASAGETSSGDRPSAVTSSMPFRVLGPHERGRFAPDAWGHLLSLAGAGLLTSAELEGVIDRALTQLDGRIALEDLRTLMDSGGFDEFGPAPDHVTIH
ncbi:MAG: DUF494 family protein [Gemmatimonadaceae bacterium]